MKRFVLNFLGLVFAISAQAQITLTKANVFVGPYNLQGLFTDMLVPAQVPAKGANQNWNYRNAFAAGAWWAYTHVSSNPQFPGSIAGGAEGELIPGKIYSYLPYYQNSNTTWSIIGHETYGQRYSIASVTGNNADSIFIPAQNYTLPTSEVLLKYPATFNTTWKSIYKHILNVTIKIPASGLNKAPMQRRSAVTITDSIVGWGNMVTPLNQTYPVLMVKRIETAVDSFYLNNSPAPASLLTTLTISQGQVRTSNTYKFYRENAMKPLAEFFFHNNNFTSPQLVLWDNSVYAPTGLKSEITGKQIVQLYPNPTAGSNITLAFEKPETGTWQLRLTDLTGREILIQNIKETGTIKQEIALPEWLKNGLYNWQLLDTNRMMRSSGNLSVVH